MMDNGPERISKVMDACAYRKSLNRKLRDGCLNEHRVLTVDEARAVIEDWRQDYNEFPPHSPLSDLRPEQFRDRSAVLWAPPAPAGPSDDEP
jgi:transposase InsO family protein